MKRFLKKMLGTCLSVILITVGASAYAQIAKNEAAKSPWGLKDEIGTLNMMNDASRLEVLKQIVSGRIYDLSVDMFIGMPTCCSAFGDQGYQIWMTHTPGRSKNNNLVSHSSDGVSMNTHTGTHIDALNHFGLKGEIWNKVQADDALETRGWKKSGIDKYPPIVARGVLIDVAKSKNVERLPDSYSITVSDLKEALQKQGTTLAAGDVVLIRTGLMTLWPNPSEYQLFTQAGLSLEAAQWLAEDQKIMMIGADNFGVESFPSTNPKIFAPVHTYLLAEKGVSLIEVLWLEELAKDQIYDFMFIASPLKMRSATASPIRPLAIPIQQNN